MQVHQLAQLVTLPWTTPADSQTRQIWHWVFTAGEIRRMLAPAGFTTLVTYSTTTREPDVLGRHDLCLVCEKR